MGLKDDIFDALMTNIQPDNPGENFSMEDKAIDKVETLAGSLSKAIIDFIKAQTFTVTKLNASQAAIPTTPSLIPMITVKVDDKGQGVDNPVGGGKIESMMSEVKLKRAVEI